MIVHLNSNHSLIIKCKYDQLDLKSKKATKGSWIIVINLAGKLVFQTASSFSEVLNQTA